jgi:hypothetical protein
MKFEEKNYGKQLKDQKGNVYAESFRYQVISLQQFKDWGIPDVVSAILYYIVDAFLRTHKLKEDYKQDVELSRDTKKSQEVRDAALERMRKVYKFDWTTAPRVRKPKIDWGSLTPHVPAAIAQLEKEKKEASEENIRKYATKIEEHFTALFS